MICFEVSLNGNVIARAGHLAAETLYANLEATPAFSLGSIELTGALPPQDDKVVVASWGHHVFRTGDEVRIRMIEAAEAAEPVIVKQGYGEMESTDSESWPFCFLCGKSVHEIHAMVRTRRAHVCDACIDDLIDLRRPDSK